MKKGGYQSQGYGHLNKKISLRHNLNIKSSKKRSSRVDQKQQNRDKFPLENSTKKIQHKSVEKKVEFYINTYNKKVMDFSRLDHIYKDETSEDQVNLEIFTK